MRRIGAVYELLHLVANTPSTPQVRRIRSVFELPLSGDDAQGGAGHKAVLTLEYDGPTQALKSHSNPIRSTCNH